jgi:hypothetical protein
MTEEAIDQLGNMFVGKGSANVADLRIRLRAARRNKNNKRIHLTADELEALLGVAERAKLAISMKIPIQVLMTKPWMALVGACDRVTLDAAQPTRPDGEKCEHEDLGPGERGPGVTCRDCGAFASERRIFEETLIDGPDGAEVPDSLNTFETAELRLAAVRKVMDNPER